MYMNISFVVCYEYIVVTCPYADICHPSFAYFVYAGHNSLCLFTAGLRYLHMTLDTLVSSLQFVAWV